MTIKIVKIMTINMQKLIILDFNDANIININLA